MARREQQKAAVLEPPYMVFPDVPILVTLPQTLAEGHGVQATLRGLWTTLPTSRTTFLVDLFVGTLRMPAATGGTQRLPGELAGREFEVRRSFFDVGSELTTSFGELNRGCVDPATRFVNATLGLSVEIPELAGRPAHTANLVLRNIGWMHKGGAQVGGGCGTILNGFLAGTILCCAGFRRRILEDGPAPPPAPVPAPGAPAPLVSRSHVEVAAGIDHEGDPTKIPDGVKQGHPDPLTEADATLKAAVKKLDAAGVFEDLNAQLVRDGLQKIRIQLQINVQDGLRVIGLAGITYCGDPIRICLNISTVITPGIVEQALAHELVHAKECAYQAANRPLPYGGHDTQRFKDKIQEYLDKLKEYEKAESEKAARAMEELFGGQEGD